MNSLVRCESLITDEKYKNNIPIYFSTIFATDGNNGGFGFNNKLPWKISADLKNFKEKTNNSVLIMGKNTFEGMGVLPNRTHIVVTSKKIKNENNIFYVKSLNEALVLCTNLFKDSKIFVIGGVMLLEEAMNHDWCESIYQTLVYPNNTVTYDTFFHASIPRRFKILENETKEALYPEGKISMMKYNNIRWTSECNYLSLLKNVLENGENRDDRTGVGTRSLFAQSLRFDLREGFPLFTTKKVFLRGVFEELMWFIRGQTDTKILEEKGVNIWKSNTRRKFLDNIGLHDLPEGEAGPIYPFQWRYFGAKYPYKSGGVDQIKYIINLLKNDPYSRRIMISAWNPKDLDKVCLPACHTSVSFYVSGIKDDVKRLNCSFNMRSSDLFLGLPFNVASYALLTHMLVHILGFGVGELVCNLTDSHIYNTHIEQVLEQISRPVRQLPTLKINMPEKELKTVDDLVKELESFEYTNIKILNYRPHGVLKGVMAV